MSFHATYNPHLLAPPTQRHHSHHNHPHNRLTQNAQASESTTSLNTGLRAKLRSALELQKHAHFDVKINIHEISNVPQLQGEFCCHWHFRGKSPKVRDGAVTHKPSLPNLKFTQARHQDSTASLPVRSVSDDKAKLPTSSASASTSQAMKGKSFSTPPFSLSSHSLLPTGKHKSVDKKGSDPTPLRNSLLGSDLQPVESPVSAGENEDTPTASSSMVGRDSASSSLYNPTSTAASSTSYLSVPIPTRHSTDESRTAEAPIPIERSSSRQTMSKSKSTNVSTHRNGVTPNKPLDKNHTCTWDQEINVSIRIPISKGDGTVGKKPTLGEGPKSASGLKLEISQLPTHLTHPKHNEDAPHPHPTTHAHAQGEKEEEESGKHDKNGSHPHSHPKGKPTAFGRVHIDLAAFAGRGRTTRKFLLKGSRTNATVQITVEMNFVGGDRDWVAPPLVEGHHVAARMKDIVGGRDPSENTQKDLQLTRTPSQSSTGSSISQGNSSISRNPSSTNPGPSSRSYPQYKSYHHHLLSAQDAKLRTPTASASTSIPRNTLGQDTTTPNDRRAGTPGLGHEDETEMSISPSTPTRSFWNHRHHHRHGHGHLWKRSTEAIGPKKTPGIKEIDSMKIIEAIFNPAPGRVEGPFTYVPDVPVEQEEEELRGEAEHHESLPDNGEEVVVGKRMGWRRRKTERKDTVSSVMTMGSRAVSGATSSTTLGATATASTRNPSPVRGGRGVSPGRIPRIGSSHAIHS